MDADEPAEVHTRFIITGDSSAPYRVSSSRARRVHTERLSAGLAGFLTVIAITGGVFAQDSSSQGKQGSESRSNPLNAAWFSWTIGILIILIIISSIAFLISRRQYMVNENKRFGQILRAEEEYKKEVLEKLKKETELATLMGLNQGQINEYHRIVTEQADKAFRSSRIAMGIGLFLLVSAAFAGAYVPIEQVRWFIGALAAFSTLLSGYLTKTYLALYKESIGQLNRYFDQPVLNSHYLTAERLAESLDRRDAVEVRRQIIDSVLAASTQVGTKGDQTTPQVSLNSKKPKRQKAPKQRTRSSMNGQSS